MSTTVVKTQDSITTPTGVPTLIGSIVTSDTFSGTNGDLLGKMSDAKLGGEPKPWVGFQGFAAANIYEISNGSALAKTATGTYGAIGFHVALADLAVQFKLTRLDPDVDPFEAFFDVRKATNGTITAYRLNFKPNGVLELRYRDASKYEAVASTGGVKVGDGILYLVVGNAHKVYINGVLKIDISHNGFLGSGGISLSRGGFNVPDVSWGIDDLVIYAINQQ